MREAKKRQTILVVDDERDIRALLKDVLSHKGYSVVEAEDGVQAIAALEAGSVDLIISDRTMPNLDGMELLAEIRKRNWQTPFVMLSAYGEEKLWADAIRLGAEDYLLKPFKPEELLQVIERRLARPS